MLLGYGSPFLGASFQGKMSGSEALGSQVLRVPYWLL